MLTKVRTGCLFLLPRLGLMVFGLLLAFGLAEIGLAQVAPQKTYHSIVAQQSQGYLQESQFLIWELVPNFSELQLNQEVYPPTWVQVSINSLGFRDTEFSPTPPPQTYRIMTLGDSFTFGLGVNNGEDYPSQLEACLQRRLYNPNLTYEVINAGYASGFSPDSFYVFTRQIVPRYEPDLILAGFYVDNDFLDMYDTVWLDEEDGYPLHIASATRNINLQGQLTYRNTLPRYKIPLLRDLHTFQLVMEIVTEDLEILQGEVPEYIQDKDIFNSMYSSAFAQNYPDLVAKTLRMYAGIDELGKAQGADMLTVIIPTGFQTDQALWATYAQEMSFSTEPIYPQKLITDYLDEHGIAWIDLLPAFSGHSDLYYSPRLHWNPEGNHLAGETICQNLIDRTFRQQIQASQTAAAIQEQNPAQIDFYYQGEQVLTLSPEEINQPRLTQGDWVLEITPTVENRFQVRLIQGETTQIEGLEVVLTDDLQLGFYVEPTVLPTVTTSNDPYWLYLHSDQVPTFQAFNPDLTKEDIKANELSRLINAITKRAEENLDTPDDYQLRWLVENSQSEDQLTLTPDQQTALDQWRLTKDPQYLAQAGIQYLFTTALWLSWLTDEELQSFEENPQYELLQEWRIEGIGYYRLYRIQAP